MKKGLQKKNPVGPFSSFVRKPFNIQNSKTIFFNVVFLLLLLLLEVAWKISIRMECSKQDE